ncbi:MAG: 16S rRNA (adenine(1518)-N(6)/adenine(1519)-N(6))-dimethyltransferase RsmA [Chitinispirillaceae bacterium]|nr:16S rRNA (adenine(1518)-N(6)/adenine(1519)-N(6))-dimethyltransferase RsmA [Chitinispirillaceae bacterium]
MKPKKYFGQHFLTAPSYAKKIVESIPAKGEEVNVLEIGPGKGALSLFLKERFPKFHLVEIDADVIEILYNKLGKGDYTIHNIDIMKFDFSEVGFPLHVVGNLPYSIASHIIKKTLFYGHNILSCTFMLQKEVAQRIVATSHSKNYGFLSVFCSFFGKAELLFNVPAGCFFPKPKVDSAVVRIIVEKDAEKKLPSEEWDNFFSFVSKGFQKRRKMAINSLSSNTISKDKIIEVFNRLNIDLNLRCEDLDCSQWIEIYKKLCQFT